MGYYDTAQICIQGHVISGCYTKYPDFRKAFCDRCGKATITQCPACGEPIRGMYYHDGPVLGASYRIAPDYCHACGKPYPWTELKMQAAQGMIAELDGLDPDDRKILTQSLDDLMADGPKTEVAGLRFKRIMKKVGKDSYDAFKTIVTGLVSEGIKKTLFKP